MPAVKNNDLPIDERFGTYSNPVTGVSQTIPLLDSRWIENDNIEFITYVPPPVKVDLIRQTANIDENEITSWVERVNFINDDLNWLLCQSHSCFWNHVIFNKTINVCLDSFLKLSPRLFDVWNFLPEKIENIQKEIYRNVFMVYLRISTHKETKENFFNTSIFGEILYENFLLDIPKVMDLCSLYGGEKSTNVKLLSKMLDNVFNKQPMYINDLHEMIPSIFEIFEQVKKELGVNQNERNFTDEILIRSSLTKSKLEDTILYLYDTSQTLLSLFHTLPSLCKEFFKFGFVQSVAAFWDCVMPCLDKKYSSNIEETERKVLKRCKLNFIKLCHYIIDIHCMKPLMERRESGGDESVNCVETFLSILMDFLPFKKFLQVYYTYHSLDFDMDLIRRYSVDETRLEYIISAVREVQDTQKQMKTKQEPKKTHNQKNDSFQSSGNNQETAVTQKISNEELTGLVAYVKDMLPDYGDTEIVRRLENFDYDVEKTMNSLLEDGVSSKQQNTNTGIPVGEDVLSTRHSIFDNDEFDVFSNNHNVDLSRVQKGKKRDTSNTKTIFDDKHESMKETILNYEYEYDDEYDDTYDTHDVGAQDADSADELTEITSRRSFTVPLVLRNNLNPDVGDGGTSELPESNNFEAHKVDNQRKNGPSVKRNYQSGANKERDRAYKDKNKSRFANHNRKAAAAKKQAKGMF